MKKFTEFLEKNCQWLAIGAGAAYLLWMVYVNLLTSSTYQVPVGTEAKSPGEVDQAVAQVAEQLDNKMKSNTPLKIPVPNFEKTTFDELQPKKMPEFAVAWANAPTQDVPQPVPQGQTPPNEPTKIAGDTKIKPDAMKVAELPKPPAATDLAYSMGIANALVPQPDPTNPQQQPVVPAAGTDVPWVTWAFKISLADLAKEFQRVNIPANPPQQQAVFTTSFLIVELVRQEMLMDGSWGPQTVCPKLTTIVRPDFPSDKDNPQVMQAYVNWATQNIIDVLQPPFYQVAKGDPWTLAKSLVGNGVVGTNGAPVILGPNDTREGFDANSFAQADPKQRAQQMAQMNPPLTNKEKQLINKAVQDAATKKAAEAQKNRAPTGGARPGGAGPGGGGPRGGGGRGGATDYAPEDGYRPPGGPPRYVPRPGMGGEGMDMGNPGYNSAQPSNYSQMFPLPSGDFDPRVVVTANAGGAGAPAGAQNLTTLVGWVHDTNCEPGHVYRYMIRYKIKNPVWRTANVAKNKAMSDQFAIASVETPWSDAIRVPAVVDFYFASGGMGRGNARVDIYRTQDGEKHKQQFNVGPGDIIGGTTNGVDYSTGFTLVDLRPELKTDRVTAWLLTPEGNLVKRDVKADSENPQKKELDQQINSAAAAAAAAGGAPAMINPTQ